MKPSTEYSESSGHSERLQFRIFSILWAIATLFHMAHSSVFDTQLNFALLTVAAFLVIIRPSLVSAFLLIVLQLFDAILRMPFTTNHWLFTAFVNLTILHALVYLIIINKSFKVEEGKLYRVFAPVIRIELIILYFFAVFHKLNSGFFSHETSCATVLLSAQGVESIMTLNPILCKINVYFTILVESIIPVLLYFKRTRLIAICLGVFFHGILSFSSHNAFYDFGAMMFALYFLFTDEDFSRKAQALIKNAQRWVISFLQHFKFRKLLLSACVLLLSVSLLYLMNKKLDTFQSVHLYFFWVVYVIAFGYLIMSYWLKRRVGLKDSSKLSFTPLHSSFYFLPLLVFVNGTSPYLGLKTENSYAMFSNLKTEGGVSNHFLIPASVQPFNFQKDVVQIISSTDAALDELADRDMALVLFEFNNYVLERQPERVEYMINEQRFTYNRSDQSTDRNIQPNPYLLSKLMKFRPFSPSGVQPCSH